jgi:hypothetical protein
MMLAGMRDSHHAERLSNRQNAGWMRDSRKFITLKDERQIRMLAGCVRDSRQAERINKVTKIPG